jgi:hypothetical protein
METQKKCCEKINLTPYTFTCKACDSCFNGFDKPQLGSESRNHHEDHCEECALVCLPMTIVADILCYFPMCLGYYKVKK